MEKKFTIFAVDSFTGNSRKTTVTGKTAKSAALAAADHFRAWLAPVSSAAYIYDSRGRFLCLVTKK